MRATEWSDTERDYVRVHACVLSDKRIAENLTEITGREITMEAARKVRQGMGLKKMRGRGVCRLVDESVIVTARPKGLGLHMRGKGAE